MTVRDDLLDHASPTAISIEGTSSTSGSPVPPAAERDDAVSSRADDPRRIKEQPRLREFAKAIDARGPPFRDAKDDRDYWYALINEKAAASFLDLERRTMQGMRQRGGGPNFIRISSRCIRYRRIDLREWAEARMRSSTSDVGVDGGGSK